MPVLSCFFLYLLLSFSIMIYYLLPPCREESKKDISFHLFPAFFFRKSRYKKQRNKRSR